LTRCPVSRFKVHLGAGHLRSPQPTAVPLDIIADHKALIAAIKEQITKPPSFVCIDTLNRGLNGDEQ
jgi:hypothetical protein